MPISETPDFTGKVIAIWLQNRNGEITNIMQKCHFEEQAGRVFLVGETVENPSQPMPFAGLKNAIAWEQIVEYVVLESVEDLYQRLNIKSTKKGWFA